MRNTKIRSWNKFENHFFYFQNGKYFKDSDCKKCVSERICSEFMWSNAEWCTELHDKNGKEIYEGDLLQDFRRTFIYECVYRENGAFEFQNKTTLNFALLHDIWDNEVIGNVFENADLVKL